VAYTVVFAPEAVEQVTALYRYIAAAASPGIAQRYTNAIVAFCEGLRDFPRRGVRRDDIRQGLRIASFRRRVAIAFDVDERTERVSVLGVYYGGRDYSTALQAEPDSHGAATRAESPDEPG
jgi:toxin ParE1/3/4